jgi:hypothetical protein
MASNNLKNQTMYTDVLLTSFNLATLPYPGQLGCFFEKDDKKYQLVLVDSGSNNLAAGDVVLWLTPASFVVTNDVSDVSGTAANAANSVAGVALGTVTKGQYAFIQVRGLATVNTNGDDDIALGDIVIAAGGTDAKCNSIAAGVAITQTPLGLAVAADDDTADTVSVLLQVPLNGA